MPLLKAGGNSGSGRGNTASGSISDESSSATTGGSIAVAVGCAAVAAGLAVAAYYYMGAGEDQGAAGRGGGGSRSEGKATKRPRVRLDTVVAADATAASTVTPPRTGQSQQTQPEAATTAPQPRAPTRSPVPSHAKHDDEEVEEEKASVLLPPSSQEENESKQAKAGDADEVVGVTKVQLNALGAMPLPIESSGNEPAYADTGCSIRVGKPLQRLMRDVLAPAAVASGCEFARGGDAEATAREAWQVLGQLVDQFGDRIRSLLARRDELQRVIDSHHHAARRERSQKSSGTTAIRDVLLRERYIEAGGEGVGPEPPAGTPATRVADPEIRVAAPQLVVPLDNARYALNAANARWGNLFDALYGSDVIPREGGVETGHGAIDPARARAVFQFVNEQFLDEAFALRGGFKFADVVGFRLHRRRTLLLEVRSDAVDAEGRALRPPWSAGDHEATFLVEAGAFAGYRLWESADSEDLNDSNVSTSSFRTADEIASILLAHNGLHVELSIDRSDAVGQLHPAGICAVWMEAAPTVIGDCEDSVAAIDAHDKAKVYANWAGLMRRDLTCEFHKSGIGMVRRRLSPPRHFLRPASQPGGGPEPFQLPGTSLLMVRHVGLHMWTSAVLDKRSRPVPEGLVDLVFTVLGALPELASGSGNPSASGVPLSRNSSMGCMYVVKPKMHGSAEVELVVETLAAAEQLFRLAPGTLKLGIMDEERRTSVNLDACVAAAGDRLAFINTGFLDRTGDEIHTSMQAGAMAPISAIKSAVWRVAYERLNVFSGLRVSPPGEALTLQIGKGMWARPRHMGAMLSSKAAELRAGATTAWVPSPTAATLHALHYHEVDVAQVHASMRAEQAVPADWARQRASMHDGLLTPPLAQPGQLDATTVERAVENCAQSILGYVVRWVDQGVGCSTVPNLDNVGLMEDRATLRISSQLLANWLCHGVVTPEMVSSKFRAAAVVVNRQNKGDPRYRQMEEASLSSNLAFRAATELVARGLELPNGYTEPVLTVARRLAKQQQQQQQFRS